MRNQTLGQLKADLRSELRQSSNPAVAQSSDHILLNALKKAQSLVFAMHSWPHMRSRRDILLQAGSRFYGWPADMDYENVEEVSTKYGDRWLEVKLFTEDDETYNAYDSDQDVRTAPVLRYRILSDTQLEVWPVPAENGIANGNGTLRIKGLLRLPEFNADTVRCPLDDDLVVLVAASRCQRGKKERDAIMQDATTLMRRLTGKASTATNFHIGGSKALPVRRQRELVVRIVRS